MSGQSRPAGTGATPAGERVIADLLRTVLRLGLGRTFRAGLPVERQRTRLRNLARLTLAPRCADFAPARCGGVPGEWVRVPGGQHSPSTILYLHGGGYCTGSPLTHRAITGHLAVACAARVFAADYRLAPEHPHPAAVDDAVAAFRGLLEEGVAPPDLVIAGDSAGGGLSVATALRLRELGLPQPRALVLFSPWVDLTLADLGPLPPGEVMLTLPWVRECAAAYLAGQDPHGPLASPVGADLRGLPATLVQVGTDELLLPDARRLHRRLTEAGVPVRLEEYPARWHVFQASAGVLADADRALESVARFLRELACD
jgi:acetyl esterase/lipase